MPYDETRPPTSPEQEKIYHAFCEVVEICYPDCRWIDDSTTDNIHVKFFSEIQIEEEEGTDKEGKRAGALYGGLDSEIDDLHLLISIEKWRAVSSEVNLLLLIHEATHIEYREHPDDFWETLVENIQTVLNKGHQYDSLPGYTERDLCIAAVHHPNPHSCDGDWTMFERKKWMMNQLPYSQADYEKFEELGHPTTDYPEFCEFRQVFEQVLASNSEKKPAIAFLPVRDGKSTNMSIPPGYIEDPNIPDLHFRAFLTDLGEKGYPPIPAPIVELRPSGEYRIVDGELAVAVAQRIGYLEIGVINTDREYETTEEMQSELPAEV